VHRDFFIIRLIYTLTYLGRGTVCKNAAWLRNYTLPIKTSSYIENYQKYMQKNCT